MRPESIAQQMHREAVMTERVQRDAFLAAHPEYLNPIPISEWPGMQETPIEQQARTTATNKTAAFLDAHGVPKELLLKRIDEGCFEACVPGVDGAYGGWMVKLSDDTTKSDDEARAFTVLCQVMAAGPQLLATGIAAAGALLAALEIVERRGFPGTAQELRTQLTPFIAALAHATRSPA
jgi:hypothetical protein